MFLATICERFQLTDEHGSFIVCFLVLRTAQAMSLTECAGSPDRGCPRAAKSRGNERE